MKTDFQRIRLCFVLSVLVGIGVMTATPVSSQNVIYPSSHPSTTYPSTVYQNVTPTLTPTLTPTIAYGEPWRGSVPIARTENAVTRLIPRESSSSSSWSATSSTMSVQSARQIADQYRRMAESSQAVVAGIADQNADFVDQWADLAETHQALADRVNEANWKLTSTTRDLDDVTTKLDHYGLTPTIGLMLRNKKEQLHQWRVRDSVDHFTSDELSRSRDRQLDLELVRNDGSEPNVQARSILEAANYRTTTGSNAALIGQVEELLRARWRWLSALKQGYQDYQQKLGELDSATKASTELTNRYAKLIDRHVIWIRSGDPISVRDVRDLGGGMNAFFNAGRSGEFGYSLEKKWKSDPVRGIGLIALILVIFLVRIFAKSWLVAIGARKRMKLSTNDARKLTAGLLTVLVASCLPAIFFMIARWLSSGVVAESTLQVANGCFAMALVAAFVEMPRQLFRNFGYIDKHVDVELPRRPRAATYMTLIGFGLILAAYVITVSGLIQHGMWRDSLSRLVFLATMMLVTWTMHLGWKPSGGFMEPLVQKFGGSVIHHARLFLYVAAVSFPLAMIALISLGYDFTASELIRRAIITIVPATVAATLWPGVKIVSAKLWDTLTGATVAPPVFDEYGEVERERKTVVGGALAEHYLELKHQLAFLCQCALVVAAVACLGMVWIDVFPNARMGNPVLWTVQDTVAVSDIDANGQAFTSTVVQSKPITALHAVLAAATLFVAFQLAKLLPALFDALILQRVSFDEGMEHFSLVVCRCVLFGVGCFIACKWLGVRWQVIQWLAVGLTIGLGFGLQDMVRNLFGGLIVLFEKPARLGDFITVGKVTGRVSHQRLRTTVLTDDDGREVIIPNKNFVGEDIVNWMGAGRLQVIPIEVAVSRDQRPADICRTLQELVLAQDNVLLAPAPQATLICVGKQSQRIEVRAWIEQGRDAARFRDELLRTVRRFLDEKNFLVGVQPTQPELRQSGDLRSPSDLRRPRKRTA